SGEHDAPVDSDDALVRAGHLAVRLPPRQTAPGLQHAGAGGNGGGVAGELQAHTRVFSDGEPSPVRAGSLPPPTRAAHDPAPYRARLAVPARSKTRVRA